ncbi:hypothetical protein TNIN_11791 [Trichonephila inaurata madagascariensis]|uniref:DUF5641 domain-containing protein n=1 Tax=Trichonephila inaurata madagascariensis TaxID=2747483 RepID=A0A8X6WUD5_9ARAC|nr:hypothetical protein TNIN_11791 [Trichonephila inaurata madagascariensis]
MRKNFISLFTFITRSPISRKIDLECHLQSSHAGTRCSNRYSPVNFAYGAEKDHKELYRSVRCKRYPAKRIESIPAPLPEDRVWEALVLEDLLQDEAGQKIFIYSDNGNFNLLVLPKLDQLALGKITDMSPGKDGCTRIVKLKTTGGEIVHPVQRLFPLELNNDDPIIFSIRDPVPDKDIKNPEL